MTIHDVGHHNERHDEAAGITLYRERKHERSPYVYWITEGSQNPATDEWWSEKLGMQRKTLRRRCEQIFQDRGYIRNLLLEKKFMPPKVYQKRSRQKVPPAEMVSQAWRLALSLGQTRNGLKPMLPVDLEMPHIFHNDHPNRY